MLACSPPPHLTKGHCHCPDAQLMHDTMTYFKEAGTGGSPAHTGVLPGHCCYLWACGTISNNISCHSCYKAKDRCYDYLHSTTLPHLKAPNSNLIRRVFTHYHHLPQPIDFWPWANVFSSVFVVVLVPPPDWKETPITLL